MSQKIRGLEVWVGGGGGGGGVVRVYIGDVRAIGIHHVYFILSFVPNRRHDEHQSSLRVRPAGHPLAVTTVREAGFARTVSIDQENIVITVRGSIALEALKDYFWPSGLNRVS